MRKGANTFKHHCVSSLCLCLLFMGSIIGSLLGKCLYMYLSHKGSRDELQISYFSFIKKKKKIVFAI